MKTLALFWMMLIALLKAQDNFKSARECGECHQEIYQDWQTSRHAKATPQKNPLFKAMYQSAVRDTDGKLKKKCVVCHTPLSSVFQSIDITEEFNKEGVTCQFCHGVKSIEGFHSAKDIKIDLSTIYSHQPAEDNEAHETDHRDYYHKSDFCLPCHAEMKNSRNLEVCSTGDEWHQYYEKTQRTCQNCHMPQVEGSYSHRFPGTHQNRFLSNAIDIQLIYDNRIQKLQVTLTNSGAGHALPTGTPLRMIYLKVVAYDSAGKVIWENWKKNPIEEDKSGLFMRILGDSEGNGPVPPWKATQTLYNRRLMPGEPVSVVYNLDSNNIYDIEARLSYRYAPSPLLKQFNITDPHFTNPKLIGQKGIKVSSAIYKM